MKRWLFFSGILLLGIGALILAQMGKSGQPIGPRAFLNFIADTSRELAHVPAAMAPLSDEDEIRIGNQMAAEQMPWHQAVESDEDSRAVQAYVSRVGLWVAGHAQRKLPYQFHYVPEPYFINAFALPGGHVFIGAGLIRLMDSEDELANILGHEVEHIDRRHCAERIQLEGRRHNLPLGELFRLPIEVFEAGYSKTQELEADRDGTALAVMSGYSPQGAIRMFEALEKLYQEQTGSAKNPQEEISRVALDTLEGYFRSHPPTAERIEQIKKLIAEEHWEHAAKERPLAIKLAGGRPTE